MVVDEEIKKKHLMFLKGRGKIRELLDFINYKVFSYFYIKRTKKKDRFININGQTSPNYFCDNKIRSTKYTVLTFIPLFLFYQFMDVLNLFYLCVSLLQIIPIFNTGYVFTFIAPLGFIILVSLINEIVDDLKRFVKDLENNNEVYYSLTRSGTFEKIYSKDIKVGDIILIKSKQRVPADCILLKNLHKNEEYCVKNEERKLFGAIRLSKSGNVYNRVNKNYYHFNKNIDNELNGGRYNEGNQNDEEGSNNMLVSENEKSNGEKTQREIEVEEENTEKRKNRRLSKIGVEDKEEEFPSDGVNKRNRKKGRGGRKSIKNNEQNKSENYTYVKTDKIDGETDWKIKYPISIFQNMKKLSDFFSVDILFILEQPKNDIYNIEGSYVIFKCHDFVDCTKNGANNLIGDNEMMDFSFVTGKNNTEEDTPLELEDEEEEYEEEENKERKNKSNKSNDIRNFSEIERFPNGNTKYSIGEYITETNGNHNNVDNSFNNLNNKNMNCDLENFPRGMNNNNRNGKSSYFSKRSTQIICNKEHFNFYDIKYKKKLNYDNYILFNSVITSSDVVCLVIYTGSDTRVNMSTQISKIKKGMIDKKLNTITIFLFIILSLFSLYMCSFKFNNLWYLNFVRFVLLFSSVIPISLSVNLNVAKIYYTLLIQNDREIKTTIIKNNSIIEDLGDIDFLFTDKTGTLTENIMILKIIHFGLDVIYTEADKNTGHSKKTSKGYSGHALFNDLGEKTKGIHSFEESTTGRGKEKDKDRDHRDRDRRKLKKITAENMMALPYDDVRNENHLPVRKGNKKRGENEHMKGGKNRFDRDNTSTRENVRASSNRNNTNKIKITPLNSREYNTAREEYMNDYFETKEERRKKKTIHNMVQHGSCNRISNQEDSFEIGRKRNKVERIVDEYLKYKKDPVDYYDDDIDDIELLKRHRVFQTFLSFLLCNNIRTLVKDSTDAKKKKDQESEKEMKTNDENEDKKNTIDKGNSKQMKKNTTEGSTKHHVEKTEEPDNEQKELARKKMRREKVFQKNFYYILNVSNRSSKEREKETEREEDMVFKKKSKPKSRSKIFDGMEDYLKRKEDGNESSDNSETFSHHDVSYQCSSPDELAFLKYATSCGFILQRKTGNKVEIKYKNILLEYDILLHIPFSSETKRMSVFVRNVKNNNIYFFIKGADNILIQKCHEKYKTFIYEESDYLSNLGLRVLVHGMLNVQEAFFSHFSKLYNQNKDVKGALNNILAMIEKNIKVLAITGVEDKLQKGVSKTIEMLYNSGIKVWVLTGDKIETAICACKNANIKKKKNNIYIFRHEHINNTSSLIRAFNSILNNIESYVLFFDNIIIQNCIKYIPNAFVDFAVNARAVVCCRCSPIEKKEIAMLIRNLKKQKILCIGDGGNDVAMIQSADIGIGVLGREGKQVVNDSDIIVSKFKNIKKLILYYGNNTFLQTSSLCSFLIHRGFILTYLQFIYSYVFFFIPVSIFQGWLQIGYTTYYTTAPFLSLLLDIKIKKNLIYVYPEIYKNKKHKRKLDLKSFFAIVWTSIFQGTVVMLGALMLFNDNYSNLINISFSSLIILEIMNIHLEVESWHPLMISANVCSFIVYIISMFTLRNYFDLVAIMSVVFWCKVILIVLFAWLPFYLLKKIRNIITPSQFFKLA